MNRVVIIQTYLPEYRLEFFRQLYEELDRRDIRLVVAYAEASEKETRAAVEHPAFVRSRRFNMLGGRIGYQPVLMRVRKADLVIVEQASKHLESYFLFLLRDLGWPKVALWGHGRNELAGQAATAWKRFWLRRADWWFAYTKGMTAFVKESGFPPARITTVQNSTDVVGFAKALASVSDNELDSLSNRLGISAGSVVGLYCGSMYPAKAMPFLLQAVSLLSARHANFHLIIVGDGADSRLVMDAAARLPALHYMGKAHGHDKSLYFARADIFLHPGVIGLAVLDAMTAGLPVITTQVTGHGPELEYLTSGHNGLITGHDVESYCAAVSGVLDNAVLRAEMQGNARETSKAFGLAPMVDNFSAGICACLEAAD